MKGIILWQNLNANINLNLLKSLPNIIGVIIPTPEEIQIILGPGFVTKVATEFVKILNLDNSLNQYPKEQANASIVAINIKSQLKQKQNFIQNFFTKFSKIFSPKIITQSSCNCKNFLCYNISMKRKI